MSSNKTRRRSTQRSPAQTHQGANTGIFHVEDLQTGRGIEQNNTHPPEPAQPQLNSTIGTKPPNRRTTRSRRRFHRLQPAADCMDYMHYVELTLVSTFVFETNPYVNNTTWPADEATLRSQPPGRCGDRNGFISGGRGREPGEHALPPRQRGSLLSRGHSQERE